MFVALCLCRSYWVFLLALLWLSLLLALARSLAVLIGNTRALWQRERTICSPQQQQPKRASCQAALLKLRELLSPPPRARVYFRVSVFSPFFKHSKSERASERVKQPSERASKRLLCVCVCVFGRVKVCEQTNHRASEQT